MLKSGTTANLLKKAREAKNLTIKEASLQTKISEKYLGIIENGEYEKLPSPTHAQGFLRNYAVYLGLDAEEIILKFKGEVSFLEQDKRLFHKKTVRHGHKLLTRFNLPNRKFDIRRFWFCLFGFLILLYLGWGLKKMIFPPTISVEEPPNNSKVFESFIFVKGRVAKETVVMIKNDVIENVADGRFEEKILLTPGLNVITITAKKKNGQITVVERTVFYQIPSGNSTTTPSL
ncbi:MAG: helix-turn-helix domain-containing protein [Patescibacteria group bacterium]